MSQIRELRASAAPSNPWNSSSSLRFWGLSGGSIAFDYGARTYRFGAGLDEAEAKRLVTQLKQRYPILASGAGT